MTIKSVAERLAANFCDVLRIAEDENRSRKTHRTSTLEHDCEFSDLLPQSYTCTGARTRARGGERGRRDSQISRNSHPCPSGRVTVLNHCRCIDCRKFFRDTRGDYFCREFRGGTAIVWATGRRYCDPPPDLWHYCAGYDGPQISKDVWVWHYGEQSHARTDSGSD